MLTFTALMLMLLTVFAINTTLLYVICKGIALAEARRPKP